MLLLLLVLLAIPLGLLLPFGPLPPFPVLLFALLVVVVVLLLLPAVLLAAAAEGLSGPTPVPASTSGSCGSSSA
jgi:hypothetical protein